MLLCFLPSILTHGEREVILASHFSGLPAGEHLIQILRTGIQPVFGGEGKAHGLIHKVKNPFFRPEADFRFRRMDIDIHAAEGERQIEDAGGVAPDQKRIPVGLLHRGLQEGGADKAAVDEEKLVRPVAAPFGRRGDKSVQA